MGWKESLRLGGFCDGTEFVRMQRKWPWPALNEGVLMINGLTNHPFSASNRLFLAAVGARLPVPDVV